MVQKKTNGSQNGLIFLLLSALATMAILWINSSIDSSVRTETDRRVKELFQEQIKSHKQLVETVREWKEDGSPHDKQQDHASELIIIRLDTLENTTDIHEVRLDTLENKLKRSCMFN